MGRTMMGTGEPSLETAPDWEFKERDVVVLMELTRDPQLSSRALTEILEEEYDIGVSHVTVSESIRRMREQGVFREVIVPNAAYFSFALFEFQFDPEHYAEEWYDAMTTIRDSKHTMFYFLSDGSYPWKSVMMFSRAADSSQWIHDFYEEHGSVVQNVRNTVITSVMKFGTDPDVLDILNDR